MKRSLLTLFFALAFSMAYCQIFTSVLVEVTEGMDEDDPVRANIGRNASDLLTAFNTAAAEAKKPNISKIPMTTGTDLDIKKLWEGSALSCGLDYIEARVNKLGNDRYEIRDIPVELFDAPDDQRYQDLVITFDAKYGSIDNVKLALENHRYQDILSENNDQLDFTRRQVILDFVENFRTAYNRKDLQYLDMVFSEDALIITGKVIKSRPNRKDDKVKLSSEKIDYTRQTKQQYLAGLKRCFRNNNYIDVRFEDVKVVQSLVDESVYGVTLKQDWMSSHYNDTGFVCLIIDFTDELKPCIQVRTWQPEQFKGERLRDDQIFSLDDFNF